MLGPHQQFSSAVQLSSESSLPAWWRRRASEIRGAWPGHGAFPGGSLNQGHVGRGPAPKQRGWGGWGELGAVMPQEPPDSTTRTSDTNHHYLVTAAQRSHNWECERTQLGQMSKHLAFTTFPPLRDQELIGLRPEKRGPLGPAPHQLWSRPLGPSPLPTHTAWTCPTSRLAGPWGSSYPVCIALGFFTPRALAERSPPHRRCSLIPATGFRSSPCACEAPHHSITSNPTPA